MKTWNTTTTKTSDRKAHEFTLGDYASHRQQLKEEREKSSQNPQWQVKRHGWTTSFLKQKKLECKHLTFLTAKKFKVCQSPGKITASIFWDAEGAIHVEFMHGSRTINPKAYCYMLWWAMYTKRPGHIVIIMTSSVSTRGSLEYWINKYICHEAWSFSMQVQPNIVNSGTHELLQLIHRNHSPYSPDISLYENHLYGALKQHMG
jgi:hypothetical protein